MVQGFSIKSRKDNSNVYIFTTSKATSPVANWENWPPLRRMSKELLISDNTSLLLDASLIVAQVHSLFFLQGTLKTAATGRPSRTQKTDYQLSLIKSIEVAWPWQRFGGLSLHGQDTPPWSTKTWNLFEVHTATGIRRAAFHLDFWHLWPVGFY